MGHSYQPCCAAPPCAEPLDSHQRHRDEAQAAQVSGPGLPGAPAVTAARGQAQAHALPAGEAARRGRCGARRLSSAPGAVARRLSTASRCGGSLILYSSRCGGS